MENIDPVIEILLDDPGWLAIFVVLLPGFLSTAVYEGLTVVTDRTPFDRIVQALTSSFYAYAAWFVVLWLVAFWKEWAPTWQTHFVAVAGLGVLWGGLTAWNANHDTLFGRFPGLRAKLGKSSASPSNWYRAFKENELYVVAHLRDGRRVYGWPKLYSGSPTTDHLFLVKAQWLPGDSGDSTPDSEYGTKILIPAAEIELVEFVPFIEGDNNG